jgi:hypothetical protein
VAKAVLAAIKMAVNDELPRLLPDRYVNLTCYDSGCDGLAAAAGVYFFSAHNTGWPDEQNSAVFLNFGAALCT